MDKAFKDLDDWVTGSDMPNGKKRVLKAAVKLFSKQGYDGTSTAQIAEESQMSQATIFKYFKSKNDLLMFIIQPIIEHILPIYVEDFVKEVNVNKSSLEQMVHFIVHNRYQFLLQNKDAFIILISQVLINDKIKDMLLEKLNVMKNVFIDNVWAALKETNELRDDIEVIQFIRVMAGQIAFYFLQTQRVLTPRDADETEHDLQEIERSIILTIKK